MKIKPKVYFRADGNARIGLGHVIRSLALADMLKNDFDCHFVIHKPLESLKTQILEVCQSVLELPETNDLTSETAYLLTVVKKDEIIVLDGYNFATDYQKVLKDKGLKVVCIDDIAAYHFVADAVINHSGGFTSKDYSVESYTKLYLGPQYALLRKPFLDKGVEGKPDNLFICLGGADPENDTIEILYKLETYKETSKCFLVLGAAYAHRKELIEFLERSRLNIEVLRDLSAEKMHYYMSISARAITPPSTVSYEYLSTGGLLFLKTIADNQKSIHSSLVRKKLALDFDVDFQENCNIDGNTFLCKTLNPFDGRQSQRLRAIFYDLAVSVRMARVSDCELYFEWINDEATRQQSYSSGRISFERHKDWFESRVNGKNSILYIMCLGIDEIGQVRFEKNNDSAVLSYSVDKRFRRKGLGYWVLNKGIASFKEKHPDVKVHAYVKVDNLGSVKLFKKLNFQEEISTEHTNSYRYVYD